MQTQAGRLKGQRGLRWCLIFYERISLGYPAATSLTSAAVGESG